MGNTPNIRFKGFTDDWEQRKLVDVVDVRSGRDYKHLEEGDIPVYGTGGYMLSVNEALSDDEDAIGIGRKGTIDNPYILRAPFWTVDTLFYAVPRDKYDSYEFIKHKLVPHVYGIRDGRSIDIDSMKTIEIPWTSYEEQKKIGDYIESLDMLTVESIAIAQKYYDMILKIKAGEDELKISDDVKRILPDFPKVAITFSVSENEEQSQVNQDSMKRYLKYYNKLFGTKYAIEGLGAYNGNLNDRLARKEKRYADREQQVDIVIVVDRLLTGFDAPCLSTLFIDRPPMSPQGLIQAFSRTNRLYDQNKEYGQIVTFRSPKEYKKKINDALVLYSKGGIGQAIAEDWETVLNNFVLSLKTIRTFAPTPADVNGLSKKQKKTFIKLFRDLDHDYAHLKSFSTFEPKILDEYGFSQQIYEDYAAVYNNVIEELKKDPPDDTGDEPIRDDYDLVAYSKFKIDFEYIVELLQGFVDFLDQKDIEFNEAEFEHKLLELKEIVKDFAEDNPKLSDLLLQVLDEIEQDKAKFMGQDMSVIINQMRYTAIDKEIEKFSKKWYVPFEAVKYEAYNYKDGELANENKLKELADYATYKMEISEALPKFKFNGTLIREFKEILMPEIGSLIE